MNERRLKAFVIAEEELAALFNAKSRMMNRYFKATSGGESIPEGARVVGCHYEPMRRGLVLLCEHESFDPVREGWMIPYALDAQSVEMVEITSSDRENALRTELDMAIAELNSEKVYDAKIHDEARMYRELCASGKQ